MIPNNPSTPRWDLTLDQAFWPTGDEWEDGFTGHPGYSPIGYADWQVIDELIEREATLVARLDSAATTAEQFEALAQYHESEDDGEWNEGLDIGLTSLALALNSAGFATAVSCRGHEGRNAWAERPVVIFAGRRPQLEVLLPLAVEAGCSMFDYDQVVALEASSVLGMLDLARRITYIGDAWPP